MASRYHLDYKVLYLPEANLSHLRHLRSEEEKKNYFLTIGYTDLGAFFTPLSTLSIQNNIRKFRKLIGDYVFDPCSIRTGLKNSMLSHVNIDMKTFVDFSQENQLEIVVQ